MVKIGDQGLAGLLKAADAVGGFRALGRILGLRHSAILAWRKIPADWIIPIEEATGVQREELRPDLYRKRPAKKMR